MKQKEVGPKAMAEIIQNIACSGRDKDVLVGTLLAYIFPTPLGGFGWSRVRFDYYFSFIFGCEFEYLNAVFIYLIRLLAQFRWIWWLWHNSTFFTVLNSYRCQ